MNNVPRKKVYGSATVGERGQIVIPADVRRSFSIKPGDKLMVFAKSEMIGLIPMEEFSHFLDQASEALAKVKK
jgi:AbrB family looped-hinge helix DNA binding protein